MSVNIKGHALMLKHVIPCMRTDGSLFQKNFFFQFLCRPFFSFLWILFQFDRNTQKATFPKTNIKQTTQYKIKKTNKKNTKKKRDPL